MSKVDQHASTKASGHDHDIAIQGYDKLDVDEIKMQLDSLDKNEIKRIRAYEHHHANRKSLIEMMDDRL